MRQSLARNRVRPGALACASLIVAALIPAGRPAYATGTATINGRVADSAGNPLKGVRVTISGEGLPAVRAVTDDRGLYRFATLWPFTIYSVSAEAPEFRTIKYEGYRLETNSARRVDFRMRHIDEREVVVLTTRDPYAHEELVKEFVAQIDVPARVIDLDESRDPEETVRRIGAEKPDLILGAGSLAAHLVRRNVHDIPSILTLVDETGQQQLKSVNLCFISHHPEARDILDRVLTVLPQARRIGMIYDADSSWRFARDLRTEAQARGLEVALGPCHGPGHLPKLLKQMPDQIDVLVVPHDPLTVDPSAAKRILRWALTSRVPVAGPNPDWVDDGALFSYGVPLDAIGLEAARVAALILHEQHQPSEFNNEIIRLSTFDLKVNEETALGLGLTIPPTLAIRGE